MKNAEYTKKWYSPKALKKMAYSLARGENVEIPVGVREVVGEMVEAIKFTEAFKKEHGEAQLMTERLRTYYVGETIKCNAGFEVWAPCRGKPTGTLVAIKTDWGIAIGISKISKEEKYPVAIVGQYLALQNALKSKESAEASGEYKNETEKVAVMVMDGNFNTLNNHERKQFERFILRAKCYFYPEVYSFSRGENPVSYPNYDEIHKRQVMILGEEKVKAMKPKPGKNKK